MIALAGGPMKVMPSFASCSAKFAFSLRKPYLKFGSLVLSRRQQVNGLNPGCTACSRDEYMRLGRGKYALGHHSDGTPR